MKVGIFGDVHLTKNMRTLQNIWEESAKKSILQMYKKFDEQRVEFVVCLGDFFDKPVLEAKSLHLVLPILNIMNTRKYPTYLLLGNHEIDDNEHNILEYLSEYENIKPITDYEILREDFLLIPYNVDPLDLSSELSKDMYVFTHHDIYGSELAGGKTKAFFGLDPDTFKEAKRVFNGHVHLRSRPSHNIINVGSLLTSQQGELRVGEYPSYYVLDSYSGNLFEYENKSSMIFLTINETQLSEIERVGYEHSRLVLRIDYEGDIPQYTMNTAHTSWRKLIKSIDRGSDEINIVKSSNFDLKNYLVEYIKKDESITDKETYTRIGLEVLD